MSKANLNILIGIFLFLAITGPAAAKTIYVDPNGSADFNSIQAAINDPCTVNGDQIEVAPGTYYEVIDFNGLAIRLYSSDGPEVTTINANGAYHAIQCINSEGADTILEGFTITGGDANGSSYPDDVGGGMYSIYSSPTVTNCIFSGNTADYGGGMFNDISSPTVTNCTFSGNTASIGGGMFNDLSNSTVTNCTFNGNTANDGGGMYNLESNPTVTNCTFSGNTADDGGGINNSPASNSLINNCILWGNTPDQIYNDGSGSAVVSYSDVQGGWSGEGNIDAEPCFVDVSNPDPNLWDLRLKPDSPCIDAGDSTPLLTVPVLFDLDMNDRYEDVAFVTNTGFGPYDFVDMGPYEFYCSGIAGDINCDGMVNFEDLSIICNNWLIGVP